MKNAVEVVSVGRWHWFVGEDMSVTLKVGSNPQVAETITVVEQNQLELFVSGFNDVMSVLDNEIVIRKLYGMIDSLPKYLRELGVRNLTTIINEALQDVAATSAEWGIPEQTLNELIAAYKQIK